MRIFSVFLFCFLNPHFRLSKTEKLIPGRRELVSMIVHHIHDIIRYSQKTMTKKIYFVYILKILEQTCGNQSSLKKKRKKGRCGAISRRAR